MSGRRNKAFTLTELMVVISIIVLLVAILLPAFGRSRAIARQALCASNLHQLANAWATRKGQVKLMQEGVSVAWQKVLKPYLNSSDKVFVCTEVAQPAALSNFNLDNIKIAVYGGATMDQAHFKYDMDLEEGPLTQKRNEANGGLCYELWFEDIRPGGGDMDYDDIILKIDLAAGTITIGTQAASYHFDLVDGPTRDVLMHDLARSGDGATGSVYYLGAAGANSYGLNRSEGLGPPRNSRILMLDYTQLIADHNNGSNEYLRWWQNTPDGWRSPSTGLPEFARHMNKCNVVFVDGSLQLLSPFEIDAANANLLNIYWLP